MKNKKAILFSDLSGGTSFLTLIHKQKEIVVFK